MSSMDKHTLEIISLGSNMIRESFEALHSVVASDFGILSRVRSGWPSILLDIDELRSQEVEEPRRRYSAKEVSRAEKYCAVFTGMKSHDRGEKKAALIKVMRPNMTWRAVSKRAGLSWQQCRNTHDSVVVAFVYNIAENVEFVDLGIVSFIKDIPPSHRESRANRHS